MSTWKITYKDQTWTDSDVTTAHIVSVAELIGDSWQAMSPWSGPRSLAAWLAVLIAASRPVDLAVAIMEVYALTPAELAGVLADAEDIPAWGPPVAVPST